MLVGFLQLSDGPKKGECALMPSILGSSSYLLNSDHFKVYFSGMPFFQGKVTGKLNYCSFNYVFLIFSLFFNVGKQRLRRHGDEFEKLPRNFFRALGRVDDTMNLGGIKVIAALTLPSLFPSNFGFLSQNLDFIPFPLFSPHLKVSSVEIERICNTSFPGILETAAIGVNPQNGGPENLLIVVVPQKDQKNPLDPEELKLAFSREIQRKLNPLFKVQKYKPFVCSVSKVPLKIGHKRLEFSSYWRYSNF